MSLNSRCYCNKCGTTYSLFSYEMKILPGMVIGKGGKIKQKTILKTWVDWIEHIATNCPNCRYRRIPPDCIIDYEKLKNIYIKSNEVDPDDV